MEVRGKRVGLDPSRAACQGYGTHLMKLVNMVPRLPEKQRQAKKHLVAKVS